MDLHAYDPLRTFGAWRPGERPPDRGPDALRTALRALHQPVYVVRTGEGYASATDGYAELGASPGGDGLPLMAWVPPLSLEQLGDPAFRAAHGLRFAYVTGAMANGIASEALVEAIARSGMLGIFGAAGLSPQRVEAAIVHLKARLEGLPFGFNLIHSPNDPALEQRVASLYLEHGVRRIEASAYLDLTLPLVQYRVSGLRRDAAGRIEATNQVIAKVSRVEVARKFLSPAPERLLTRLVEAGAISEEQARLAAAVPMADDVTAEADSGGHTDNRPLVVLLPALMALRDTLHTRYGYAVRPRIGAAGGIATPASVAAAFSLGAAYVVTGSINQACLESGSSDAVRRLLADAGSTDVAMAPAADMFELGVDVQVLSRGTLFPTRARKLYELYRSYDSIDALPAETREALEKTWFNASLEDAWEGCRTYFEAHDPAQLERAQREPKHKLALLFRSYLGQSSRWANAGVPERRLDYQVWCGPAMGAFNAWVKGSWLEAWDARRVVPIAQNLLVGAAVLTRVAALRAQGLEVPADVERVDLLEPAALEAALRLSAESLHPASLPARPLPPAPLPGAGRGESTLLSPLPTMGRGLGVGSQGPGVGSQDPEGLKLTPDNARPPAIAIVGIGCLFPGAPDQRSFWRSLRLGVDAITDVPATHWSPDDYFDPDPKAPDRTYARRGAFLEPYPFDPTAFGIPPNILEATDTSQLLGLVGARMALEDAGYTEDRDWDRSRASVILGVTGTQELVISLGARLGHPHWRRALRDAGIDDTTAEDVVARIGRAYVGWQENSFPGLLGNVVAGRIANRLNLGGTNCVIDAACASSLGAVHLACLELQTGRSDLVVTGGVDALNDIFMYMCFSKTPALSPTGDARPFAADADGTILGEGIGIVVLRRLEDAIRQGDHIYAVIKGIGTSSDGRAKSIYAPLAEGQSRALRAAYLDAGVSPDSIGLVEAHGTGTRAGDACEFEALRAVYREARPEGAWCALGSVKSQIGHTKAAAGAAGLIKAALALEHKVLPPTLKVERPNPALELERSPFYLPVEARPWLRGDGPRRAAVSAFGFGGSNFHAVLEEHRPDRTSPAWDGSVEILAVSASDVRTLTERLQTLVREWDDGAPARSRAAFRAADPFRITLVLEHGRDPDAPVERAIAQLERQPGHGWSLPEGIHFGTGHAPGKLAFLFPGQGSQYVGMLRDLTCIFPEMLEALEASGDIAQAIHPPSTFEDTVRRTREAVLTRTDVAQPALGAVSRGALEVLARFGVVPDLVAGHSFGELVALYAAGCIDADALTRLSQERGALMAGDGSDRGTMLAVMAPVEAIDALVREHRLEVVLANYNTPAQGVLSGGRTAIARAESLCRDKGIRTRSLEVAAAFHSPLVAGVRDAFRAVLETTPFSPGRIPVIADSTAALYPADASAARDLLAGQLAEPVRFVDVVERLYTEGARTFLEVGPRSVLTGMVRAILGERPFRAAALDSAAGRRDGIVDLAQFLAQVAALGYAVDLSRWQEVPLPPHTPARPARKPRMVIPLCGANHREPDRAPLPPRRPATAEPHVDHVLHEVVSRPRPAAVETPSNERTRAGRAPAQEINGHHGGTSHLPLSSPPVFGLNGLAPSGGRSPGESHPSPNGVATTAKSSTNGSSLVEARTETRMNRPVTDATFSPVEAAPRASTLPTGAGHGASSAAHLTPPAPRSTGTHGNGVAPGGISPSRPPGPALPMGADRGSLLLEALRSSQESLLAMQSMQERTAAIHQRFLEGQEAAQQSFQSVLEGQQRLIEQVLTGSLPVSPARQEPAPTRPVAPRREPAAAHLPGPPLNGYGPSTGGYDTSVPPPSSHRGMDPLNGAAPIPPLPDPVQAQPAPAQATRLPAQPVPAPAQPVAGQATRAPAQPVPASSQPVAGQATRAPAQVMPIAEPSAAPIPGGGPDDIVPILLSVVADATGYPTDMLGLDMDLESDLGIDSIKRVEILSMLSARIPEAPSVEPEHLSNLHTLRQVADFIGARTPDATDARKPDASGPLPPLPAASADEVHTSAAEAQELLISVVAELTGYPREMLGLELDMESDLGIDSIKRVEILSHLAERLPGAKAVEPEQLSSLHTLGQVLRFIAPGEPRPLPPVPGTTRASLPASRIPRISHAIAPPLEAVERGLGMRDPTTPLERLGVVPVWLPPVPEHPGPLAVAAESEIWVRDDGSELARALVRHLSRLGNAARLAPPTDLPEGDAPPVAAVIVLEGSSAPSAAPSGTGSALRSVPPWASAREEDLKGTFRWVRGVGPRLRQAGSRGGALLVSISRLDGACGLDAGTWTEASVDPLQGAIAGLTKTAAREWPEVRCRALDVAPDWDAEAAAAAIVSELHAEEPLEVGLSPRGRRGIALVPEPVGPRARAPEPGDLVVVSGGARGVTAACAEALARTAPLTLLLLGRSPAPEPEPAWLEHAVTEAEIKRVLLENAFPSGRPNPRAVGEACQQVLANREIRRTLGRISGTGSHAIYCSVDVRDASAVARCIDDARRTYGPVRGLVHGAGVLHDRRIEDKTDAQFAMVFDTKVGGMRALLQAIPPEDLRFLGVFTSVSGRFGRRGQADYAMANQALDKIAQLLAARSPGCRVVALNWGPWDGGMVSPGLKKEFDREGVGLIALEAGARQLVDELLAAPGGSVEVVIGRGLEPAHPEPDAPPGSSGLRATHRLDPHVHSYLADHCIAGRPVLPVAMMAEWFARAATDETLGVFAGLEDLRLHQGVVLEDGPLDVEIWAGTPVRRGDLTRIPVELRGRSGRVHARSMALLMARLPEAPAATLALEEPSRPYPLEAAELYPTHLFHGPRLHAIDAVEGVSRSGIAVRLRPAPPPSEWIAGARHPWVIDPLVLDGVFQALILWCRQERGAPSLPSGFGAWRQYRETFPSAPLRAVVAVQHVQGAVVKSDVELTDQDGLLVARLEGCLCTVARNLEDRFNEPRAFQGQLSSSIQEPSLRDHA